MVYKEDEIAWLYVEPNHMRRGIGKHLIMYVMKTQLIIYKLSL